MGELELITTREEEEVERVEGINATSENNGQSILEEGRTKSQGGPRRNPPARNTSRFWFERFLAVIQRQNPSVIDSSFLSQIAPNNEGKLLAQLKFLHLIDEQGKPTPMLSALNMVGSEQKKGFQQIVRESYGELMSEIVVEKAVVDDVVNYFIRRYAFTRDKAIFATKFFLYLAEKGSLNVSPELSSFLTEKGSNGSSSPATTNGSIGSAMTRIVAERSPRVQRESSAKAYAGSGLSKRSHPEYDGPSLQTVINIKLDKDTPKEYWDRVLSLMGERREVDEKSPNSLGEFSQPS